MVKSAFKAPGLNGVVYYVDFGSRHLIVVGGGTNRPGEMLFESRFRLVPLV
jgi:hypothetical protein